MQTRIKQKWHAAETARTKLEGPLAKETFSLTTPVVGKPDINSHGPECADFKYDRGNEANLNHTVLSPYLVSTVLKTHHTATGEWLQKEAIFARQPDALVSCNATGCCYLRIGMNDGYVFTNIYFKTVRNSQLQVPTILTFSKALTTFSKRVKLHHYKQSWTMDGYTDRIIQWSPQWRIIGIL